MKLFIFFTCSLLFSTTLFAKRTKIDGIAAIVEGSPILYSDVVQKVQKGPLVAISDYPSQPTASESERALNDSINMELILKVIEQDNLEIDNTEVETEITKFLSGQGTDKAGLVKFLKQQGRTYEGYKEDFATQLLMRRFQGRYIMPLVKITNDELKAHYKTRGSSVGGATNVKLHHILFKVQTEAGLKKAQKKAIRVLTEINKSGDFFAAVRKYSQDEYSRSKKGFMGDFKVKDLHPAIKQVIMSLNEKQPSPPTVSPLGMHIFYVASKKGGKKASFEDLKPRLEAELRSLEITKQTQLWLLEKRAKAKIKIVKKSS